MTTDTIYSPLRKDEQRKMMTAFGFWFIAWNRTCQMMWFLSIFVLSVNIHNFILSFSKWDSRFKWNFLHESRLINVSCLIRFYWLFYLNLQMGTQCQIFTGEKYVSHQLDFCFDQHYKYLLNHSIRYFQKWCRFWCELLVNIEHIFFEDWK